MAMQRHVYTSRRTGEVHVYEYPPPPYMTAAQRCRYALGAAGELTREGNRWRAGKRGRRYQNVTVQELVSSGRARIDGNTVRPK
jgi:hypothetical protein